MVFIVVCLGLIVLGIGSILNLPDNSYVSALSIRNLMQPYFFSTVVLAGVLCATALAIELIRLRLKLNYIQAFLSIWAFGFIGAGLTSALFSLVIFVVSSILVGRKIFRALAFSLNAKLSTLSFLLGAGVFGTIVSLSVHFPINNSLTYAVLLGLPVFIFHADFKQCVKKSFQQISEKQEAFNLGRSFLSALCLFYVSLAAYPEMGYDALAVHLFIPEYVSSKMFWNFEPNLYVFAFMPLLADWMYTIVFVMGGEEASRLLNVFFLFVVCINLRIIVKICGGDARVADIGMILFLLTPLTLHETQSMFVENIFASYITVTAIIVALYLKKNLDFNTASLSLGFTIGFSLAIKAVSLVIAPIFGVALLLQAKSIYREWVWSSICKSFIILLLMGMIPYIRGYLMTGNPVFPFYNLVFESPFYPPVNFDNPLYKSGLTWRLLYDITFNSSDYLEARNGIVGLQWLAIFPASVLLLIASKNKTGLLFTFFGVGILCVVFQFQSYLRYVYPSFAIMTATTVLIFSDSSIATNYLRNFLKAVFVICLIANSAILYQHEYHYKTTTLATVTNSTDRDKFLRNSIPIRAAVDLVNKVNVEQKPVVILGAPLVSGLNADAIHSVWYNTFFAIKVRNIKSKKEFSELMHLNGSEFLLLDDNWWETEQRTIVQKATVEILRVANLSVRQLVQ